MTKLKNLSLLGNDNIKFFWPIYILVSIAIGYICITSIFGLLSFLDFFDPIYIMLLYNPYSLFIVFRIFEFFLFIMSGFTLYFLSNKKYKFFIIYIISLFTCFIFYYRGFNYLLWLFGFLFIHWKD